MDSELNVSQQCTLVAVKANHITELYQSLGQGNDYSSVFSVIKAASWSSQLNFAVWSHFVLNPDEY